MTNIGIVGAEAAKFTPETAAKAKALIRELLSVPGAVLVSGRCPLGGIDVWAEEIADELCIPKHIHVPEVEQWDPPGQYGFKARNLDIARDSDNQHRSSDIVHVIVVAVYPLGYEGRTFLICYHCAKVPGKDPEDHVKSGGCWTAIKAMEFGKRAMWHVIE